MCSNARFCGSKHLQGNGPKAKPARGLGLMGVERGGRHLERPHKHDCSLGRRATSGMRDGWKD